MKSKEMIIVCLRDCIVDATIEEIVVEVDVDVESVTWAYSSLPNSAHHLSDVWLFISQWAMM